LLWLAIQLVAIGLAAARVPFFADYPQQGEFQAPRILLVVQWLGIAALFPILLPDLRGVVWIVASSVVMLAFAGALAAEPLLALAPAGIYSILYVVVVFGWSRIARSMRAKMILSAILVTSLVGGPNTRVFTRGLERAVLRWSKVEVGRPLGAAERCETSRI